VSFFTRLFSGLRRSPPISSRTFEITDALLSKSKYLIGLQCPKALWIHYNNKNLIPAVDTGTAALFDQGHKVGLLAQRLFPEGIHIGYLDDFDRAIESTRAALSKRQPLFEPAFSHRRCFSRADILDPVEDNRWDIIEVKSSTEVKPVFLHDLAFQRYVYEGAGLAIRNCYLMHVNNAYVKFGEIDPTAFFSKIDATGDVAKLLPNVGPKAATMLEVLDSKKCPDIAISPHCDEPYECALKPVCWSFLPQPNVFDLRYGGKRSWDLFNRGVLRIEEIPEDFALTDNQSRQIAAHRSQTPHIDRQAIPNFLKRLQYPLYFLDFETISPAIPLFDHSRPYQQIPFQFSLHVMAGPGEATKHFSFLADGPADPRPELLAALKPLLGVSGSIVGYNTKFEIGRLRESAEFLLEYRKWSDAVCTRFVDLLDVFGSFAYYHPAQNGSASLKAVLPAMTGATYSNLQIQDGDTASREFMRITFGDASKEERSEVRQRLDAYCKQDTQALIDILSALQRL
jgi:hypothetical protein